MPPRANKAQIHPTIWNAAHKRLDQLAAAYDPMTKNDVAAVLLYYGLKHARVAMREWIDRADDGLGKDFEDDWNPPKADPDGGDG